MTVSSAQTHRPSAPPALRGPRPACEVVVGFTCVRPSHVAAAAPGTFGFLVTHHGTCGYCPGQPNGRHQWADAGGITLNELLRSASRQARPRRTNAEKTAQGGRP